MVAFAFALGMPLTDKIRRRRRKQQYRKILEKAKARYWQKCATTRAAIVAEFLYTPDIPYCRDPKILGASEFNGQVYKKTFRESKSARS